MVHHPHTSERALAFSCQNLHAQQGGRLLYDDVGFSLLEGATLVISGANGCGKTTLLKQLAGMSAHEGTLTWFDEAVTNTDTYERDMVYIGDRHGLYPELTVEEQLHYIAKLWGNEMLIPAAIRYLEFEPYLGTRIAALSAGWKRRVALARLLLIPSLLWLLDEPMMHLDSDGLILLGGMINSHAEKGGITILTMPMIEATPSLYETPVSTLLLEDFAA